MNDKFTPKLEDAYRMITSVSLGSSTFRMVSLILAIHPKSFFLPGPFLGILKASQIIGNGWWEVRQSVGWVTEAHSNRKVFRMKMWCWILQVTCWCDLQLLNMCIIGPEDSCQQKQYDELFKAHVPLDIPTTVSLCTLDKLIRSLTPKAWQAKYSCSQKRISEMLCCHVSSKIDVGDAHRFTEDHKVRSSQIVELVLWRELRYAP